MSVTLAQSGNGTFRPGGTIASGTPTTFTGTIGAGFGVPNVGNNLTVHGAGAAGGPLFTSVTATAGTSCTISPGASTAVSGAPFVLGIGQACDCNGTTFAITLANAVAAGDLLVLGLNVDASLTFSSVADNALNTWSAWASGQSNADYFQRGYACLSAAASSAGSLVITITPSGALTGNGMSFALWHFASSVAGTWSQDSVSTGSSTGTAMSTGSLVTTHANSVFVGFTGVDLNTTTPLASGFTSLPAATQLASPSTPPQDNYGDLSLCAVFTSAPGATPITATQSGSSIWMMTGAVFGFTPSAAAVPLAGNMWLSS